MVRSRLRYLPVKEGTCNDSCSDFCSDFVLICYSTCLLWKEHPAIPIVTAYRIKLARTENGNVVKEETRYKYAHMYYIKFWDP